MAALDAAEELRNVQVAQGRIEERVGDLEKQYDRIEKKLTAINNWLIGLMGSVIVALILLVVNLGTGR